MVSDKKDFWWRKYTKKYVEEEPNEGKPIKKEAEPKVSVKTTDPFTDLESVQNIMDKLFGNLINTDIFRFPEMPATLKMDGGVFKKPRSNVRETEKEVLVRVEMPGATKNDIKIKIEGLNLIIDAQVKKESNTQEEEFFSSSSTYQGFRNIIKLPCNVKKEGGKAKYEHGVLEIVLLKKKVSDEPSDIPIE